MLTTFIPPKEYPTIGPNLWCIDRKPETPSLTPMANNGSPMNGNKCLGPGGKSAGYCRVRDLQIKKIKRHRKHKIISIILTFSERAEWKLILFFVLRPIEDICTFGDIFSRSLKVSVVFGCMQSWFFFAMAFLSLLHSSRAVFLNRRDASRYRKLETYSPGHSSIFNFFLNLSKKTHFK
jgi:hypothetical protein